MTSRRARRQGELAPKRSSLADLPVRIGELSWAQWLRATIYTVIVLIPISVIAITAILHGTTAGVAHLLSVVRWL